MEKLRYKSFEAARIYVQSLGYKNQAQWYKWSKNGGQPKDIPSRPYTIYANTGWAGWKDFLGYK